MQEVKVLDHGLVALVDHMGNDYTPATTARTSYGARAGINQKTGEAFTDEENRKLNRYLYRNRHTTPFEFNVAKFYMVMPIFVARQWVRHRTASINEESMRYIEARDVFYIPAHGRMCKPSTSSKQGSSSELVDDPGECQNLIRQATSGAFSTYKDLLNEGLAAELARIVLPLNTYTAWMWKCDLHNIMHLLSLRRHPHAQWEIRQYAEAVHTLLCGLWPNLMEDIANANEGTI